MGKQQRTLHGKVLPPPNLFFFFLFNLDLQYCPWKCILALVARTTCFRHRCWKPGSQRCRRNDYLETFFSTDQFGHAVKTYLFKQQVCLAKKFLFHWSDLFVSLCILNLFFFQLSCLFFPFHKDSVSVTAAPQRSRFCSREQVNSSESPSISTWVFNVFQAPLLWHGSLPFILSSFKCILFKHVAYKKS